jgi:hypothetical protein
MPKQISVIPDVLDLKLYAGDGVDFRLTCSDPTGAPINLSGSVQAQVRVGRLDEDSATPLVIDTTAVQHLIVTAQHGAANANISLRKRSAILEIF